VCWQRSSQPAASARHDALIVALSRRSRLCASVSLPSSLPHSFLFVLWSPPLHLAMTSALESYIDRRSISGRCISSVLLLSRARWLTLTPACCLSAFLLRSLLPRCAFFSDVINVITCDGRNIVVSSRTVAALQPRNPRPSSPSHHAVRPLCCLLCLPSHPLCFCASLLLSRSLCVCVCVCV
jgi:hypothetical protein